MRKFLADAVLASTIILCACEKKAEQKPQPQTPKKVETSSPKTESEPHSAPAPATLEQAGAQFKSWWQDDNQGAELPSFVTRTCHNLGNKDSQPVTKKPDFVKGELVAYRLGSHQGQEFFLYVKKMRADLPDGVEALKFVCKSESWIAVEGNLKWKQTDLTLNCPAIYGITEIDVCLYKVKAATGETRLYYSETTNGPACVPSKLYQWKDGEFVFAAEQCTG